ncbi:MAG: DinB family protein, partial [Planctomycetota bacterium]
RKVLGLASDLSDEQLDATRPIGFGTLRNTLFHILEAEKLWLERWQLKPWRALVPDAGSMSVAELGDALAATAQQRNQLLSEEAKTGFQRVIEFKDSLGESYAFPVGDLMSHVANHGIHHRSQALQYLKGFERTIPGGLDYLFYKLAHPTCSQPEESYAPIESYGLAIGRELSPITEFDQSRIQRYLSYSDWAMGRIYEEAASVSDEQLDQDFGIGMGTLRQNLQHMNHAELWWLECWQRDQAKFPSSEGSKSLSELREEYETASSQRSDFCQGLDTESANRIVSVAAGGPVTCYRVTESLLQLACHGTHHRSQCVNILRQLGITFSWIDLIVWIRENS